MDDTLAERIDELVNELGSQIAASTGSEEEYIEALELAIETLTISLNAAKEML